MCGIVGYIGRTEASPILLDGLWRLEYRGYDSAGIAVWDGVTTRVIKTVGRVDKLVEQAAQQPLPGSVGIAHTRWATHGMPTLANAHPQTEETGDVLVVHNGIIENYETLKRELERDGCVFSSETDTEVIPHLIKKFLKPGVALEVAVRRALKLVKGTYAMLVMSKSDPDKLVAARQSSPLRIGVGQDEFIVASDASAIVHYTKQLITLSDGEVAVVTRQGYSISELTDDKPVGKALERVDWEVGDISRGEYSTFMLKEIFEQPEAVKNSLRGRLNIDEGRAVLGGLRNVEERLRKIERIHIVACGTAYHAGLVGEYMFEEYAGIPTEVCVASEFRYRNPRLDPERDAVLAISQSGETADTLAAVTEAKSKGLLTLGIVNVVGSSIAHETDAGVYNHAGPEIGVASTKAFVSQLVVLSLFTLYFGRQRSMSLTMGKRIAEELRVLPVLVERVLASAGSIQALVGQYQQDKNFYYLGRKYNYPVALEGALKLKEISYVHAEGGASGELKHGPLAMFDGNFPTVFIAPHDSVYEKSIGNIQEVKARSTPVIAVVTEGDTAVAKLADATMVIPKTLEMLTPILSVVPLQLFAYYFAVALGRDVDKPRNLAKSVTVE